MLVYFKEVHTDFEKSSSSRDLPGIYSIEQLCKDIDGLICILTETDLWTFRYLWKSTQSSADTKVSIARARTFRCPVRMSEKTQKKRLLHLGPCGHVVCVPGVAGGLQKWHCPQFVPFLSACLFFARCVNWLFNTHAQDSSQNKCTDGLSL